MAGLYHEISYGHGKHYNGIRLRSERLSPWETVDLFAGGDNSLYWEGRARRAEAAWLLESSISDETANAFMDRLIAVGSTLTWKQVYYLLRVATWSARLGERTLVELVRETGLGA